MQFPCAQLTFLWKFPSLQVTFQAQLKMEIKEIELASFACEPSMNALRDEELSVRANTC